MLLPSHPFFRSARRPLCAALCAVFTASLLAQPVGLSVVHGGATVQQAGSTTTVTTVNGAGTSYSALDWRSFQVPTGTTTFFSQPSSTSTSINRVTGGDPSSIFGTLGSNGRLVLVNPAGIAVGTGAVVDTAGFTASTLDISSKDLKDGRLRFDGSKDAGGIKVEGQVLARSGDVVLIGPRLETGAQAVIEARGGDVVLAAGQKVELTGRGLEGILMQVRAPDSEAVNLGTLRGDSVAIFAGQLHHSGLVQANSLSLAGGKVVLQGDKLVELAGRVEASTANSGGIIQVSGDRIVLRASTVLDVSHANGGGQILVGGGKGGKDGKIPNAKDVDIEEGVQLKADATLSGSGGTIVAWSDDQLKFRGEASSKPAGKDHKGGDAEVAAKGKADVKGKVQVNDDEEQGKKRAPGKRFDPNYVVAVMPLQNQPQEVQEAVGEPVNDTVGSLTKLSAIAPLGSEWDRPGQRKVVVTAVQCTVVTQ